MSKRKNERSAHLLGPRDDALGIDGIGFVNLASLPLVQANMGRAALHVGNQYAHAVQCEPDVFRLDIGGLRNLVDADTVLTQLYDRFGDGRTPIGYIALVAQVR